MVEQKTLIDDANFIDFMVVAKRNTYASGGESKPEHLPNGGKRYVFYDEVSSPQRKYEDTWHGTGKLANPFFGREIYFERLDGLHLWIPVAQMVYDSYTKGTEEQVQQVFAFLQKMLQRGFIFRGPTELTRENGLQYHCQWTRLDPYRVQGKETILDYTLHQGEPPFYQLGFQFCCLR